MGGSIPGVVQSTPGRQLHKHTEIDDGVGAGDYQNSGDFRESLSARHDTNEPSQLAEFGITAGTAALSAALWGGTFYYSAFKGQGDEAFEFQRWVDSYDPGLAGDSEASLVDEIAAEASAMDEATLLSEEVSAETAAMTEAELMADLEGFGEVMLEAVEVLAIL